MSSDIRYAIAFSNTDICESFIMAYKMKEPNFWNNEIGDLWYRVCHGTVLTAKYERVENEPDRFPFLRSINVMLDYAIECFPSAYRIVVVDYDYSMGNHIHEDSNDDLSTDEMCSLMDNALKYTKIVRRVTYEDIPGDTWEKL